MLLLFQIYLSVQFLDFSLQYQKDPAFVYASQTFLHREECICLSSLHSLELNEAFILPKQFNSRSSYTDLSPPPPPLLL